MREGPEREAVKSPRKCSTRRVSFDCLPGTRRVKLPSDSGTSHKQVPFPCWGSEQQPARRRGNDVHEAEDLLRPVQLPAWHTPQLGEERLQLNGFNSECFIKIKLQSFY